MKKISLKLVFCCALSSQVIFAAQLDNGLREGKNDFVLTSPIISLVDGTFYGVDGQVFLLIMKNRREIRSRIYGTVENTGKPNAKKIGLYNFAGKKYSLVDLVAIEFELENNKFKYSNIEFQEKKKALLDCLERAKEDFITITNAYTKGINSIKDHMLVLIEEFCQKNGIINESMLLKWGEIEAGQEERLIRQKFVTFKDFTQFCIDTADFLEVFARSCPKGEILFGKMIEEAKKKKASSR
ncbi:MAG: hypothetical protein ACD_82C00187G0002 [uncultured bacterium]|nr:MAG: hypothetical protein ACD_82C00187G0002 [uncultured bacterium]KKP28138.1 MAG: hypothetical protein UR12_C0025G0012 [candidate division TM6 bacterium GW2011_GWF2_30_66]